ncbi:MAG: amidohydrolase family protein [Propionibacteriaceae bacterium]|jgi:imidazolonepropionase-like amidohydrolase|nr:amidohydrolase family protein [Propionibacteriaceae bacterium]
MELLAITNARIVSAGTPAADPTTILAVDGEIANIDANAEIPAAARVVDAAGRSVLPGLTDAHCHAYGISMSLEEIEHSPLSYVALKAAHRLGRALRRGFTTIRDVAGGDAGLARAIREGLLPTPRYLYTGAALSQTGGHGDGRHPDYDADAHCGCSTTVVDGVDQVLRTVRENFRRGATAIKLLTSGGVISESDPLKMPQYSAEEVRAATYEADRRGSYVAAHAYSPEAIIHSVSNGVRTIEHGNLLDQVSAEVMAAAHAYLVPTLIAYDAMDRRGDQVGLTKFGRHKNSAVLMQGKDAIRIARAHGIPIGFGSDLMGDLEDEQLGGLRLQAEVEGVERAIEAATMTNAEIFQRPDLGRVQRGCVADLLILDGDVLATPDILWEESHPRTVIQAGRVVHDGLRV